MSNQNSHPTARPVVSDTDSYSIILSYLAERGHTRAEAALRQDLASDANQPPSSSSQRSLGGSAASGGGKSVGLQDFAARNAPSAQRGVYANGAGNGANGQQRRRPDQAVANGQLLADPSSWEKGYEGLRTFVENVRVCHSSLVWTRIGY